MIELVKDNKLKGFVTVYVNYMLAASRRYMDDHKSFDRYEFYIYNGSSIHGYEKVDVFSERINILSRFNSIVDMRGISFSASGFEAYTAYLGIKDSKNNISDKWYSDYLVLKESARRFAAEYGVVLMVATHFAEVGGGESIKLPHVHILYTKPEFEKDCFSRWFAEDFR